MSNRPTDETTAGVVAEWKGWDKALKTWNSDVFKNDYERHVPFADNSHVRRCADPRDDTDEAMKLLNWLMVNHIGSSCELVPQSNGTWWLTGDYDRFIPGSGEPFRTAVVELAGEVIG